VLLLGVGEDGHIASVFPEHPAVYETRPAVAVRGAPKPPPIRITLTPPAINTAEEVWLIATGPEKADAVGMALSGAGPVQVPAAGVSGVSRTLWLLDRDAAAHVGPRRPGDPATLVAATGRITRELGWRPERQDLAEIIRSAWQYELKRFEQGGASRSGSTDEASL